MSRLSVTLLVLVGVLGGWVVGTRWDEVVALVTPPPPPADTPPIDTDPPAEPLDSDVEPVAAPAAATSPRPHGRKHTAAPALPTVTFAPTAAGVQGLFTSQAHRLEQACYARFRHRAQAAGTDVADFTFHVWVDATPDAPGIVHIATAPETDAVLTTEGRSTARLEAACLVRALSGARAVGPVEPGTRRHVPLYGKTPLGNIVYPRFAVKLPVFVR